MPPEEPCGICVGFQAGPGFLGALREAGNSLPALGYTGTSANVPLTVAGSVILLP